MGCLRLGIRSRCFLVNFRKVLKAAVLLHKTFLRMPLYKTPLNDFALTDLKNIEKFYEII